MLKKIIYVTVIFCSFSLYLKNGIVLAKEYDRDSTKVTTFKLNENKDGMFVSADNLDFGNHELTSNDLNIIAENEAGIEIMEVSGKRPGWTLKAELSSFKGKTDNLNGTELFFPLVTPKSITGGIAANKQPVILGTDQSFVGNLQGQIIHVGSGPVKLAQANVGFGFGEWKIPYEKDEKVQLRIPTGQKPGAYIAKLVYTLEEGPIP